MAKADPEKLVHFIIQSILGGKGNFTILKIEEDDTIKLEIKPERDDFGKIVGKSGNTIWAIRRLASIAGTNLGKKVQVTLEE